MSILKVIFLLSATIPFCFAHWILKSEYGDTLIYTSPGQTRLTISYKTTAPKQKNFSLELIKSIAKDKKKMLAMIGIEKWKVEQSSLKKSNGVTSIKLVGSYLDRFGEKVHFVEYHYYTAAKKLQMLLTNNKKESLNSDDQLTTLQKFKVGHGF